MEKNDESLDEAVVKKLESPKQYSSRSRFSSINENLIECILQMDACSDTPPPSKEVSEPSQLK